MDKQLEIGMLIATMAAMVTPKETTRKFDKLRKDIRKGVSKEDKAQLKLAIASSNRAWEAVKAKLNTSAEKYAISLPLMMVTLYDLLPSKCTWFTQRTFDRAIGSMEYGWNMDGEHETRTTVLSDMFREELGIKPKSRLFATKVKILQDNKILTEG